MFRIKNPFKKEENVNLNIPTTPLPSAEQKVSQPKELEDRKVDFEVLVAKIDVLKFQYEALNETVSNIERMVKEIYEIAKSTS